MTQRPVGTVTLRTADGEEDLPLEGVNLYETGLRSFHDAVAGNGSPAATGEDGIWSLATALAVMESSKTGTAVKVQPGI